MQPFNQDLIYAVTWWQHQPPRHSFLPNAVKTGNMDLIQTLNKLWYAVYYSHLEQGNTALCLQKLASGFNHKVVLLVSIKPRVFPNLTWDNIDTLEETLTGNGT